MAFSLAATVAGAAYSANIDDLQITTRPFSTGTRLAKAEIESRKLINREALAQRVALAAASLNCPSGKTADIEVEPLTVRDYIGDTTTRLSGVGLYVSMEPTAERSTVESFIDPYIAVTVRVTDAAKRVETFEIWEFERIPLNRSTNLDFVKDKPAAVESAIMSFAQKTLEMHFRRRAEAICLPQASKSVELG
jgi:hypothetical protein